MLKVKFRMNLYLNLLKTFGFIGMFDYWASVPVLNGTMNATNGNFIMSEKDITLSGRGPDVSVERTYNSQSKK